MKKYLYLLATISIFLVFAFKPASFAQSYQMPEASSPTPSALKGLTKPEPPLEKVQQDRLIVPKQGIGKVKFGMSLEAVEKAIGRGDIQPDETDFTGNTTINLVFKDQNLIFKFFNGELAMIIIENKEYGTKTGVHCGGSIGDAIREFGTDFRQEKSIVQDPDPEKLESEIFFDKYCIAFKCMGRIITKVRLLTPMKIKGKQK
ncbi:MAG: hypothetical protein LWY06_10480 [Firmicutes bacterium]|nr:hypothetical protein [Bacillota bacterium]